VTTPDQASKWTYRSFINNPASIEGDADKLMALLFAEATMIFQKAPQPGTVKGLLDMGGGYFLDLTGTYTAASGVYPATTSIIGAGRDGTPTAGWEYDYQGFVVPSWPKAINQVPAFVGSVIRAKPHNGGKAGVTASFISVLQP
jgi:hypothetical protein